MTSNSSIPIAVVGLSCRFPGGANDPEKLWSMLSEGRDGWSEVPSDRFNFNSFHHPDLDMNGSSNHRGGHFLDQDISKFDTGFFGIPPIEAQTLDPQQRIQLESAYEALENAGIPLQDVYGSNTSVYCAMFSRDYLTMMHKDTIDTGRYHMTGTGDAILSNRISYVFDLKGPSITLDTGCSGSLAALHLACQDLRAGQSDMAIAAGVNLILGPDMMIAMSLSHVLNSDGKSYSFDTRGSGYGRGEGVATLVLKRLDDALEAGDNIRVVIRGTGVNQDGKTAGIFLPDQIAQENLSRSIYDAIGLDPLDTAYVEAHGTGTVVGDATEIKSIANTFCNKNRKTPLYVGSIKPNIGHLESASGIAGLLKGILAIEKGQIPPNVNLKTIKKELDLENRNIKIPQKLMDWPVKGVKRVSVSSFGYGGTNGHVVLEEAPTASRTNRNGSCNGTNIPNGSIKGTENQSTDATHEYNPLCSNMREVPYLLTMTARSEYSLLQNIENLKEWLTRQPETGSYLADLQYTLNFRRTLMPWRSTVTVSSHESLISSFESKSWKPQKSSTDCRVVFLFTGQGAQWFAMGRELIYSSTVFKNSLGKSAQILQQLGASWDLFQELTLSESDSRVNQSEIGQPASTAIQIALVDHLESLGIQPSVVLGHSSGEIAAAYAAGALSQETSIAISYHRSFLSKRSREIMPCEGSMAAVGLSESEAFEKTSKLKTGIASIACINGPSSTTISGDESAIDELIQHLKDVSIFARKLKVDTAYHSHHMEAVSQHYLQSMEGLEGDSPKKSVKFISSVTSLPKLDGFGPEYWVTNLVSKVRFYDALKNYCLEQQAQSDAAGISPEYLFVEIGPHSALAGPFRQTIQGLKLSGFKSHYSSALTRGRNAQQTTIELAGRLLEHGYSVDLSAVCSSPASSGPPNLLKDLPPYAWDNRTSYWHESRLSEEHRFRAHPHHDLLGVPVVGSNPQQPVWRNLISVDNLPWVKGHVIDGFVTFPGTGYVTMAVEAIRQHGLNLKWPTAQRYVLRDLAFMKALLIPESPAKIEVQISMKPSSNPSDRIASGRYNFRISSFKKDQGWSDHCSGSIMTEFSPSSDEWDVAREQRFNLAEQRQRFQDTKSQCSKEIDVQTLYQNMKKNGNVYDANFAVLTGVSIGKHHATGTIVTPDITKCMPANYMQPHVIHPATIDSILQICIPIFMQHNCSGSIMPTHIEEFSISAEITNKPGDEMICAAYLNPLSYRAAIMEAVAYQKDTEGELIPVITVTNGEIRAVGEANTTDQNQNSERQFVYHMKYDIDVDFVTSEMLRAPKARLEQCAESMTPEQKEFLLTYMTTVYINDCMKNISDRKLTIPDSHLAHLFRWMKDYWSSDDCQAVLNTLTDVEIDTKSKQLLKTGLQGEILTSVGPRLTEIVTGEVDARSILLADNLSDRLYSDEPALLCATYLKRYIEHLRFKNPHLKILEIGAGTGGTTKIVLELTDGDDAIPFKQYDFTDISSGLFESARTTFSRYEDFINYKTLDIEHDPVSQGFEEGSYDLVIAANVIHATTNISNALTNARKLLKPGGSLALIELVRMSPGYNLTSGMLPEWWNGVDDGRTTTPLLTVEQWESALSENSFSGVNIAAHDYDGPAYLSATMISTAVEPNEVSLPDVRIIQSSESPNSSAFFVPELSNALKHRNLQSSLVSWPITSIENAVYVVLDLGEKPILTDPIEQAFTSITKLITRGCNIIWISKERDGDAPRNAENGLVAGFSRVARSEYPELKFVIFDIQQDFNSNVEAVCRAVSKIISQSLCTKIKKDSEESEYVFRNNQVLIPRIIPNSRMDDIATGFSNCKNSETGLFYQKARPLKLFVEKPGLLDSLIFVDDEAAEHPLQPDELEIQTTAFGINFKDVFIALGQMKATTKMVGECSGVVTAIGSQFEGQFQVGDRVCAWGGTPYASHTRVKGNMVHHIPDSLSFEIAASIPVVFATAYYGLVQIARLQKGQKVLIHAAAGGVGQAAIVIAQNIGAEIFATVGSAAKRDMLINDYGIPESHVFSSRLRLFKPGILRLTEGNGVDVVLNSLSGEALHDTWDCIARFGTFVEIGKFDIYKKSQISMAPFDKNVSFASVDLVVMAESRPDMIRRLLADVMGKFADGSYSPVKPITTLPISEIESAFRQIQGRKHTGKLVLTADHRTEVKVTTPKPSKLVLDSQGSYLIAGGLGYLGQEMARYMAEHGARSIILLTRRSLDAEELKLYEESLLSFGAKVKVMTCDINSIENVKDTAAKCASQYLSIKGIVQGTMVLRDRTLETLGVEDYQIAVRPKVLGTQNLIEAFSGQSLDFFLMLSSCTSVIGGKGQANYAAGNAFMDFLALSPPQTNTYYSSLNIGYVLNSVQTSSPERMRNLTGQGMIPIETPKILNLLGYLMSKQGKDDNLRQVTMGFNRETLSTSDGWTSLNHVMLNHLPYSTDRSFSPNQQNQYLDGIADQLKAAKDIAEARDIIAEAIGKKISAVVAIDKISLESPLVDFGLDSLVAVELKNWFLRSFQAVIQTNEILGAANVKRLAMIITERSAFFNADQSNGDQNTQESQHHSNGKSESKGNQTSIQRLRHYPVPNLEYTLNNLFESVKALGTEKEVRNIETCIQEFLVEGGRGQQLQKRLEKNMNSSKDGAWLNEFHTTIIWLQLRYPIRPTAMFYNCHPLSTWQHGQAERATIVSLTAFQYNQDFLAGNIEPEYFNDQPYCMETHKWLFNAYRRPAVPHDVSERHPGCMHIAVLRQGQVFKVDLDEAGKIISFDKLQAIFQAIIDEKIAEPSLACILTVDERTSWSQVRELVKENNSDLLNTIETALFLVCLDEGAPSNATERSKQFILDDNTNRWNDKSLQFIICENGVSASFFEHSRVDASTLNQLNKRLGKSILDHQPRPNSGRCLEFKDGETPFQFYPFISSAKISEHINRCQILYKQITSTAGVMRYTSYSIGANFLRQHRVSPKSAWQAVIQLAIRYTLGHNPASWDSVSLGQFRHCRVDLTGVMSPAMVKFCNEIENMELSLTTRKKMFLDAVNSHVSAVNRAVDGKSWNLHLALLKNLIEEGDEVPSIFQDELYIKTRPGKVYTSFTVAEARSFESGIILLNPNGIWIHYEPQDEYCTFSITNGSGMLEKVVENLERAAAVVKEVLGSAPE